jgi:hypothetical protein
MKKADVKFENSKIPGRKESFGQSACILVDEVEN